MIIEWNENPLNSRVLLDDQEKKVFKLLVERSEMIDDLYTAQFYLMKDKDWYDPERAYDYLDIFDEDCNVKDIDETVEMYLIDLERGFHIGDCTCFPMACTKCWAESLISIDTIEGLGKHPASKIKRAFGYKLYDVPKPIDMVIESLNKPSRWEDHAHIWKKREDFEKHVPRWNKEGEHARNWLIRYKEEKLREGRTYVPILHNQR